MAPRISPSLVDPASPNQDLSDRLDADIARVRAEIESLKRRKHLLTFSLLSSTKVHSQLGLDIDSPASHTTDLNPSQIQVHQNEINIHRLTHGVTAFPFTDPNPDTSDRPLLGVRFDIPSRNGRYEKAPYYIFLKRVREDKFPKESSSRRTATTDQLPTSNSGEDLKIHHHTIPAFIPLQDYEAKYLPQNTPESSRHSHRRDEGYHSPSPTDGQEDNDNDNTDTAIQTNRNHTGLKPTQDLHALVTVVRRDLTSWQLRHDSISLLAEQLNLATATATNDDSGKGDGSETTDVPKQGKFSLQTVQVTTAEARFCRLVWENGAVGRLRLTDDGHVDRAVVIGDVGDQGRPDRMRDIERLLSTGREGGTLPLGQLLERLEEVDRSMSRAMANPKGNHDDADAMDVDQTQ